MGFAYSMVDHGMTILVVSRQYEFINPSKAPWPIIIDYRSLRRDTTELHKLPRRINGRDFYSTHV